MAAVTQPAQLARATIVQGGEDDGVGQGGGSEGMGDAWVQDV